ncbi:hypothetical protein I7I48_01603 [Histoplasma ohiense]|nr:hypothetical protein I7I48_01603 [Histoplasma ohiense (nom. inval.)]
MIGEGFISHVFFPATMKQVVVLLPHGENVKKWALCPMTLKDEDSNNMVIVSCYLLTCLLMYCTIYNSPGFKLKWKKKKKTPSKKKKHNK